MIFGPVSQAECNTIILFYIKHKKKPDIIYFLITIQSNISKYIYILQDRDEV